MSSTNALKKENVPGWGADLSTDKRPGYPKESNRENIATPRGNEYHKIPRQMPTVEVLVSTEHKELTPVFGTTCPPHGVSGVLRRLAFKFSEGQKRHWLILLMADRVDVLESALTGFVKGQSHNPFKEMGWSTEFHRSGFPRRFGHKRADTKRWGQELLLAGAVAGAGYLAYSALKKREAA